MGVCLVLNLLHQHYKGIFKHMRDWVEQLLGTKEFNEQFKSMPTAQDLQYFKTGITTIKIWMGWESQELMRQFLPVAIDAQVPLTNKELTDMENALAAFHNAKHTLIDEGIFDHLGRFDWIKLRMLGHYPYDICKLGVPDGYIMETPEHLHIIYIKIPWHMSSWQNPLPQMVTYVCQVEGADEEEIRRYAEAECEADQEEEPVDEGSKDGEDSKDVIEVEGKAGGEVRSVVIHYPRLTISVAWQPMVWHIPGHMLLSLYGATGLILALRLFILAMTKANPPHDDVLPVLLSEHFDPCQRDVVHVQPPVHNNAGHVKKA
ncbi:hypothetical protein FRC10_010631, partial [Ceratobasidium sp. 414]